MAYTAGDGVKIENNVISAKISEESDNATGLLDGAIYTPATMPTDVKPILSVTVSPLVEGLTVTAAKGSTVLSGITDANSIVEFEIPAFGVWTLNADFETGVRSKTISIEGVKLYSVNIAQFDVYGVSWDGSSSTVLPRTDGAALFSDPVAAVGTGEGSSPFDDIYPWSAMEEYNIIDGQVAYKKGDEGFSRTDYDTVVYIPEFWYQASKDEAGVYTWKIASVEMNGFEKHPGSGKYVAKYITSAGYMSRSGTIPLGNITRTTARNNSVAKGSGWSLFDAATLSAIQILYLIEFANWNSQVCIGMGNVKSNSVYSNGTLDSMVYHTGRADGTDGETQTQYRGIEGVIGNVWTCVDGINISDRKVYLCTSPEEYADDTAVNYVDTGIILPNTNGIITNFGISDDFLWAFLPISVGGSSDTYITDQVYQGTGWTYLIVGGACNMSSNMKNAGLWCLHGANAVSYTATYICSRLIFNSDLAY